MSGETEEHVSGWTTDTLKIYLEARLGDVRRAHDDLRRALDERFATQTKATDKAFEAQQTAMKTAFDAADKAVQAALAAAEKAALKAEMAAGDRFKAVNEFRGQLADQAATLISRVEHAAEFKSLNDKLTALADRMNALELRLTSRLDLGQGHDEGSSSHALEKRSSAALTAQWAAIVVVAIGVIVAILVAVL